MTNGSRIHFGIRPQLRRSLKKVTASLALPGGDPSGSALPVVFDGLMSTPQRRDDFLHGLTAAAAADRITQLTVTAVIPFAARVLLLRRHDDDSLNGRWELSSGPVEPGLSLVEAVTRVARKDTGLEIVRVRSYLSSRDCDSGRGQPVRQYNFVATVRPLDQITLTRHAAHAWARPDKQQPVSAADQAILTGFIAELKL